MDSCLHFQRCFVCAMVNLGILVGGERATSLFKTYRLSSIMSWLCSIWPRQNWWFHAWRFIRRGDIPRTLGCNWGVWECDLEVGLWPLTICLVRSTCLNMWWDGETLHHSAAGSDHHLVQKVCNLGLKSQRSWNQGPTDSCNQKYIFHYTVLPSEWVSQCMMARIGLEQKLPICVACWHTCCTFARKPNLPDLQRSGFWRSSYWI